MISLAFILASCLASRSQNSTIDDLILQLNSDEVGVRNRAASVLLAKWKIWKEEDLAALKKASKQGDAEVAGRAKEALGRILLRKRLGENLLAVQGMEETILDGKHEKRVALLETVVEQWTVGDLDRTDVCTFAAVLRERGIAFSIGEVQGGFLSHRLVEPYVTLLVPHLKSEDAGSRAQAARGIAEFRAKEFVPDLLPLLRDRSPEVRSAAIYALSEIGDPSHIPSIATLLGAGDPDVRASAAYAMGKLGAKEQIPGVAKLLKDPEVNPRYSAARALGMLGAKDHLPQVAALLDGGDRNLRSAAAEAIGRLEGTEHARKLAQLMGDPDEFVRRSAAEATFLLQRREAIPDLLALFGHRDYEVHKNVVKALVRLDAREQIDTIAALIQDKNAQVRRTAAEVIGALGARERAPTVASLLEDPDAWTREIAASVLRKLRAKEFTPRIAKLLKDPKASVRSSAAWALARMEAREFKDGIVEAFRSGDQESRGSLFHSLTWIGKNEEIGIFLPLLQDADRWNRSMGARALGALGARESARELLPLLKEENLRHAVVEALGELDFREHAKELLPLLADSDDQLQYLVASVLVRMEAKEAIPGILKLMKNVEHGGGYASLLLNLGDGEHLDACIRRLSGPDAGNRAAAALALGRLGLLRRAPAERETIEKKLSAFEKDVSDYVQCAATIAAVRLGRKDRSALRPFLEDGFDWSGHFERDLTETLAHLCEPESFQKFMRPFELKKAVESEEDLCQIVLEEAGLRLELDEPFGWGGRVAKGVRTTVARLLDRLISQTWLGLVIRDDRDWTYILEADRLRITTFEKARSAWRRWLAK